MLKDSSKNSRNKAMLDSLLQQPSLLDFVAGPAAGTGVQLHAGDTADEHAAIRLLTSRSHPDAFTEVELGPLPPVSLEFVVRCLRENERGDAQLFARIFADLCVHDASATSASRGWHFWREHYWEEDEQEYIRLLASGPLADIYQKASKLVTEQSSEETPSEGGQKPTVKVKERERLSDQLSRRAEQVRTLRRTDNILGYAQTLLGIKAKVWDSNPWLLGTRQGVIDLRTGKLRTGRPDDHIRTIIPATWKGLNEPAPRFQQFLQEIFGDREEAEREELIAFLQRALGYGITGLVNERIFLMLYGEEGRNGKDTLMHALEHVLGKTVGAISSDVLLAGSRFSMPGSARPHLCSLQGKRIAWVSETSRDAHFAIEQIKQLTGGEPIVTRQLYTREYTFDPSHLLIMLTNHRPEADAADSAFWERICPIVFNQRFVEQPERPNERQRDPNLSKALEAEASGILAWLVRGTLEWSRHGLAIPESVRQARKEYRVEESNVLDFVSQCCVLDDEARTPAGLLYRRYKHWASENALTPANNKQFSREMKRVGQVAWLRSKRGNVYVGIRLQEEGEVAE